VEVKYINPFFFCKPIFSKGTTMNVQSFMSALRLWPLLVGLCLSAPASAALEIFICGGTNSAPTDCRDHGGLTSAGASKTGPQIGSPGDQVVVRDANGLNVLRVPVNPAVSLDTPPGWSGPASPPSTASSTPTYSGSGGGGTCTNSSSVAGCFAQALPSFSTSLCGGAAPVYTYGSDTGSTFFISRSYPGTSTPGSCTAGGFATFNYTVGATCPTGYTLTSGSCNLTTPSVVPKPSDSKIGVTRSSNTFAADTLDADNVANVPPVTITSSAVTMDLGDGRTVSVTIDGAGKSTVSLSAPSGGNTSVSSTTIGSPGTGAKVEGTTTQTFTGTGSGTASTPNAKTDTSCQGGDCATEGTLKSLRDNVASGVKQDEQASTWASDRSTLTSSRSTTDSTLSALASKGTTAAASGNGADLDSNLGNLVIPSTAPTQSSFWSSWFPAPSTCTATSLGGTGRFTGLVMDMCPVLNALRPVLEWGLWILTALVIYQAWFGGRDPKLNYRAGA